MECSAKSALLGGGESDSVPPPLPESRTSGHSEPGEAAMKSPQRVLFKGILEIFLTLDPYHGQWHVVPIAMTSPLSRANCVGVGPNISAAAVDSASQVSDGWAGGPRNVILTVEPANVRNAHDQ